MYDFENAKPVGEMTEEEKLLEAVEVLEEIQRVSTRLSENLQKLARSRGVECAEAERMKRIAQEAAYLLGDEEGVE